MGVRVAKTAGFCWGVKRAVDMALRVAHEKQGAIYTYGPLIHNRQALDLLKTKNIERLPDEGEDPGAAALLIRAHGVTPESKQSLVDRGFDVVDATCPHVMRAQKVAARQAAKEQTVIIVGDKGHAEVNGLLGHAAGRGLVVESPEDAAALPGDLGEVSVVAQTTQGGDRWERCIEEIRKRYPDAQVFNTRCNDTNHRQCELLEMAAEVDAVVVVGGRGSANTTRLAHLASERGVPTWHVEVAEELPLGELAQFDEIGVTAGASTPHWIIEQVVDALRGMQRRRRPLPVRLLYNIAQTLLIGQVILATSAAALAVAAARLMEIDYHFGYSALPFLYLWAMHLLHLWATLPRDPALMSGPQRQFVLHRQLGGTVGFLALGVALVLSAFMGPVVFGLVLFSTFVGAIYSLGKIPAGWFPRWRFRHLHQIPGSKDLCVAAASAMLIVVVPWIHAWLETSGMKTPSLQELIPIVSTALFIFLLVLVRSVSVDYRQLEGDLLLGRETLPVIIGRRWIHRIVTSILVALGILAAGGFLYEPIQSGVILLAVVVLTALIYGLTYRQKIRSHLLWGFLLDLPFLAAGVLALV